MKLRDDERAQSIQVGAVLLFGVLVILFSVYQAVIVPSQNQEVEFNHNQRVQGDIVELRNAVLETKSAGQDGFASVELGTQYSARLVGLNPPSPSGVLQTTAARPVVVEQGGSDITDNVCPGSSVTTRAFEYTPSYSEYQNAGTLRYENSVLYQNFSENAVVLSSQQLVRGDRVQLIPLNGSYREASSRTVSVDFKPGRLDTSQRDDINVTVPTRLPEQTWEELLSGQVNPGNVTVTAGAAGRNLTLTLSGTYTISCGPVGVGQVPASGPRGSGTNEINPAAPGDIRLVSDIKNGRTVTLQFNNTGGTNNFTAARINFYNAQSQEPDTATVRRNGEPDSATLNVPGGFETFNPDIRIDGDGQVTDVELEFNRGNVNPNDWFVVTFELETGETALYFVSLRS